MREARAISHANGMHVLRFVLDVRKTVRKTDDGEYFSSVEKFS